MGQTIRAIVEGMGPGNPNLNPNPTTQLVKSRWPPVWSGQKFDKWKLEIEKWTENNWSTEEHKYVDLMESLKKNEAIKDFVTKTLVEKVGETRTVQRILDLMAAKYAKTLSEKIMDTMKKICGFQTDKKVDVLLDDFEEMVTEAENVRLAPSL